MLQSKLQQKSQALKNDNVSNQSRNPNRLMTANNGIYSQGNEDMIKNKKANQLLRQRQHVNQGQRKKPRIIGFSHQKNVFYTDNNKDKLIAPISTNLQKISQNKLTFFIPNTKIKQLTPQKNKQQKLEQNEAKHKQPLSKKNIPSFKLLTNTNKKQAQKQNNDEPTQSKYIFQQKSPNTKKYLNQVKEPELNLTSSIKMETSALNINNHEEVENLKEKIQILQKQQENLKQQLKQCLYFAGSQIVNKQEKKYLIKGIKDHYLTSNFKSSILLYRWDQLNSDFFPYISKQQSKCFILLLIETKEHKKFGIAFDRISSQNQQSNTFLISLAKKLIHTQNYKQKAVCFDRDMNYLTFGQNQIRLKKNDRTIRFMLNLAGSKKCFNIYNTMSLIDEEANSAIFQKLQIYKIEE